MTRKIKPKTLANVVGLVKSAIGDTVDIECEIPYTGKTDIASLRKKLWDVVGMLYEIIESEKADAPIRTP